MILKDRPRGEFRWSWSAVCATTLSSGLRTGYDPGTAAKSASAGRSHDRSGKQARPATTRAVNKAWQIRPRS